MVMLRANLRYRPQWTYKVRKEGDEWRLFLLGFAAPSPREILFHSKNNKTRKPRC